jgi:hypothetical protein
MRSEQEFLPRHGKILVVNVLVLCYNALGAKFFQGCPVKKIGPPGGIGEIVEK